MNLSRAGRRAYHQAWYRKAFGTPSEEWKNRPGSTTDLEIWMNAFDIAAEENVSPWDALLLAVRRRAARVRVIDQILEAAWEHHRQLCTDNPDNPELNPDVPSSDVRVWFVESRNEERLLTRAAKMAIDAGVAKMLVERDRLEGRLLADALVAGLDSLELSTEQRMKALGEAQKALTAIAGAEVLDQPNVIPGIRIDDDDDKKED